MHSKAQQSSGTAPTANGHVSFFPELRDLAELHQWTWQPQLFPWRQNHWFGKGSCLGEPWEHALIQRTRAFVPGSPTCACALALQTIEKRTLGGAHGERCSQRASPWPLCCSLQNGAVGLLLERLGSRKVTARKVTSWRIFQFLRKLECSAWSVFLWVLQWNVLHKSSVFYSSPVSSVLYKACWQWLSV